MFQDYNFGSKLGKGGFATVYSAIYKPTGDHVAVKVVSILYI